MRVGCTPVACPSATAHQAADDWSAPAPCCLLQQVTGRWPAALLGGRGCGGLPRRLERLAVDSSGREGPAAEHERQVFGLAAQRRA